MTAQLTPFIAKLADAGLDAIKNTPKVAQIIQLAEIKEGTGILHRTGAVIDGQHAIRIIFLGSREQLMGLQKFAIFRFKKVGNTPQYVNLVSTDIQVLMY
jgi:hypothetical protein